MEPKSEVTLSIETGNTKRKLKNGTKRNQTQLVFMLLLTFSYFLVEIVVGYLTNSVALVADSFHMLSDVISLVIAFIAVRISPKKWSQNTFGWARAEVLGALVNAVFLIALCLTIVADSLERFINPKPIENPKLVLIVGSVGLLINLIGLALFHEHGHSHGGREHSHGGREHSHKGNAPAQVHTVAASEIAEASNHPKMTSGQQMNMHGVFLHVFADALGSVIVIIAALVIWLSNWEYKDYVDPVLSILMVTVISISTCPLLVDSAKVMLQTIPNHIQIEELKRKLMAAVKGVQEIHEFHIWQLSGSRIIVSAHIVGSNQAEFMKVGEEVKTFFHNEGMHSTTIQLEFAKTLQASSSSSQLSESDAEENDSKLDCFLRCPSGKDSDNCASNSCCGIQNKKQTTSGLTVLENNFNTVKTESASTITCRSTNNV